MWSLRNNQKKTHSDKKQSIDLEINFKKRNITILNLLIVFSISFIISKAQNDTMYIMKNGIIVGKYNIYSEIDSIIFYRSSSGNSGGTFVDSRDGNTYPYVIIGNQTWMASNLKYLPEVTTPQNGSTLTPYCYVYDYNGTDVTEAKSTDNYNTYGVLYNWAAAMNSCPSGWHLPSLDEWNELIDYLESVSGQNTAGGKLKETGTTHWNSPNTDATNETGFSALPTGERNYQNAFAGLGNVASFWTATEYEGNTENAWFKYLLYNWGGVAQNNPSKDTGMSVRCIKNK